MPIRTDAVVLVVDVHIIKPPKDKLFLIHSYNNRGKMIEILIHIIRIKHGIASGEFKKYVSKVGRDLTGTDAAKRMVKYAFEELGLHKLYLRVISGNLYAIRMG